MDDSEIPELLRAARTIAVVGMKDDTELHEAAHAVPRRLQQLGYDVRPVNPTITSALGRDSVPDLAALDVVPDIVNVFRRVDALPGVADDVLAMAPDRRPRAVWFQTGLADADAARRLREAGIMVVEDRCIGVFAGRVGGPA
ncbi:MAG: CoA-binding protein [Gemmatimonadales bacterium]|nr:CoA-binding protein [Gemmatimonadales bacterium]